VNVRRFQKRADPQGHGRIPEQDRTAVVDARYGRVRWPHQDRTAFDDLAGVRPTVPEAREGQGFTIGTLEKPRLLLAIRQGLPFVEAGCRNDTAAVCPRLPESGLVRGGLDAGIEGAVAGLRLLGPMGDQSPSQHRPLGTRAPIPDDRDGLGRMNVVMRRKVWQRQGQKPNEPSKFLGVNRITSAHRLTFRVP